jgi:hypothetical protein
MGSPKSSNEANRADVLRWLIEQQRWEGRLDELRTARHVAVPTSARPASGDPAVRVRARTNDDGRRMRRDRGASAIFRFRRAPKEQVAIYAGPGHSIFVP